MAVRENFPTTAWWWILAVAAFLSLSVALPLEDDLFFGADENKIREKPKYLVICRKSDPNINECVKSSVQKFVDSVDSGAEELNLPSIDPIEVPLIEIQKGSGNVSLHVTFKNFRILGFKNFKVMSARTNLADNKFEIFMESSHINMLSHFAAEGGIYTFPIVGQGDFHLNLSDVSVILILRLTRTDDPPGLRYFVVEDCIMDILPGEINAYVGEYIDGSNVIGAAVNAFFNTYAHEIFIMIKPQITKILENVFESIANRVLSRHPDDVLLPD